jgi:hypothetical protein
VRSITDPRTNYMRRMIELELWRGKAYEFFQARASGGSSQR